MHVRYTTRRTQNNLVMAVGMLKTLLEKNKDEEYAKVVKNNPGKKCKFFVFYRMDFLLLRSFDNYINASITLARLDEEGITCYLKDEYTVTIDPILSNAVGGIKLMVHPGDIEEARTLLAAYDKDYREAIVCPKCGSHDVEYISKQGVKNWVTALVSWFFSSYAVAAEQVYHCFACSSEFTDLPEPAVIKENV